MVPPSFLLRAPIGACPLCCARCQWLRKLRHGCRGRAYGRDARATIRCAGNSAKIVSAARETEEAVKRLVSLVPAAVMTGLLAAPLLMFERPAAIASEKSAGPPPAALISIDYPANESVFPPDMTAPTFVWRDASAQSSFWTIEVEFSDGSPAIQVKPPVDRLSIGEIDARCVAETNEPPRLTREQSTARTWIPDRDTWTWITKHSVEGPARVTITGFSDVNQQRLVSRGQVTLQTDRKSVV